MVNLGKIKKMATERGITLESLSQKAGISPQAMSRIMRTNSTSIDTLEKIAEALGVSPAVFFESETSSPLNHDDAHAKHQSCHTERKTDIISLLQKQNSILTKQNDVLLSTNALLRQYLEEK